MLGQELTSDSREHSRMGIMVSQGKTRSVTSKKVPDLSSKGIMCGLGVADNARHYRLMGQLGDEVEEEQTTG